MSTDQRAVKKGAKAVARGTVLYMHGDGAPKAEESPPHHHPEVSDEGSRTRVPG